MRLCKVGKCMVGLSLIVTIKTKRFRRLDRLSLLVIYEWNRYMYKLHIYHSKNRHAVDLENMKRILKTITDERMGMFTTLTIT